LLELDQVVKHYRATTEAVRAVRAIDGVSLLVAPGEMTALEGPSGSGKTTLLKLAATVLTPDHGTIRFMGRDIASFSDNECSDYLYADVGYIEQRDSLMPRVTALENASMKLMMGGVPRDEAEARALQWLERVGLSDRANHTPEQLSGGERQRVAIAQALTGKPKLIFADEPTANLNSTDSAKIIELLAEIAHDDGAGVVLVTHDAKAAGLADHRFTLGDGKLHREVSEPAPL
jgi:putative ABC transport system ATP-binding protein